MGVHLDKKKACDQMMLAYDCLTPEEACKLIMCFNDDELCEMLQWLNTSLVFDVMGTNTEGKLSKSLVLFIETLKHNENGKAPQEAVDELLEADRELLVKIKDRIHELSGI